MIFPPLTTVGCSTRSAQSTKTSVTTTGGGAVNARSTAPRGAPSASFAPLSYKIFNSRSKFQGVQNQIGGLIFNVKEQAGFPTFGLGFESRFQNSPQGVDTEQYMFWNPPKGGPGRRPFQVNLSWGPEYGAPASKPVGWTRWSFDVNRFGIGNGHGFVDDFSIDLDAVPHRLRFAGDSELTGNLVLGGNIDVRGGGENNFTGPMRISNGSVAIYNDRDVQVRLTAASGDTAIRWDRTPDGSENMRLGAASEGEFFSSETNIYTLDLAAPNATRLRDLLVRGKTSDAPAEAFVRISPRHKALAIGSGAATADLHDVALHVGGGLSLGNGTPVQAASHGTINLSAGVATVDTSLVSESSRIFLTVQVPGGDTGTPYIAERTPGQSFTVKSSQLGDTSEVAWLLIEP